MRLLRRGRAQSASRREAGQHAVQFIWVRRVEARFENERYMRVYARDTATWKLLIWLGAARLGEAGRGGARQGLAWHGRHGAKRGKQWTVIRCKWKAKAHY